MEKLFKSFILAVPWIFMMSVRFSMPPEHPWKDNPPSFDSWVEHATPLLIHLGFMITFCIVVLISLSLRFRYAF